MNKAGCGSSKLDADFPRDAVDRIWHLIGFDGFSVFCVCFPRDVTCAKGMDVSAFYSQEGVR